MADLYGEAASLLQGAGNTAIAGTRPGLEQEQLKQQGIEAGQNRMEKAFETASSEKSAAERQKMQEQGALEREKASQAGETQREGMKTERQFTTLTPELINGLKTSDPRGGWDHFKPGQKIQTDVLLGLHTARMKQNVSKPAQFSYTGDDGKEHKMAFTLNPETGDYNVTELAQGKAKETATKGATEKDLKATVDREMKNLPDLISKHPTGGLRGLASRVMGGGDVQDLNQGLIRTSASNLLDSLNKLRKMGSTVDIDPAIENKAKEIVNEGGGDKRTKFIQGVINKGYTEQEATKMADDKGL